jgi:hypothetical protein
MLLARYFLYVGGALLAVLLIVSAVLPQAPVVPSTNTSADLPAIRINSDRKWPAKVVFDTSASTVVPTQIASNVAAVREPVAVAQPAPATPREAFAQLAPPDLKKSGVRKSESKLHQRHKVARRRMGPPPMMMAQQPQYGFGFFGSRIW